MVLRYSPHISSTFLPIKHTNWCILTLSGHYRLRVLLRQHAREPIEAGLLDRAAHGNERYRRQVDRVGRFGGEHVPGHLAQGHKHERREGNGVACCVEGCEQCER